MHLLLREESRWVSLWDFRVWYELGPQPRSLYGEIQSKLHFYFMLLQIAENMDIVPRSNP